MKKKCSEENFQYWKKFCYSNHKLIVFYGKLVLDLTQFAKRHPGSQQAIRNYRLMDVESIIFNVYSHPPTVVKTLKAHQIGLLTSSLKSTKNIPLTQSQKKVITYNSKFREQQKEKLKKSVRFEPKQEKKNHLQVENDISLNEEEEDFDEQKPQLLIPNFSVKFKEF